MISRAMRLSGVLSTGENPSSAFMKNKYNEASDALHAFLLGLQNESTSPFKITRSQSTFSESSQVTNDSVNYRCILSHTSAATTEPGTGANWTTYWAQDGDGSDGAWALSTAYTSKGQITLSAETLAIMNVKVRDIDNDSPVDVISRSQYYEIADKGHEGLPNKIFFDAQLTPVVYVWPQPDLDGDDEDYVLHYDEVKIFNDFDNNTDTGVSTSNFPLRWVEYITFALGYRLAMEWLAPIERIRLLEKEVNKLEKAAKLRDSEDLTGDTAVPCP